MVGEVIGADRRVQEIVQPCAAIGDEAEIAADLATACAQARDEAERRFLAGDEGAGGAGVPSHDLPRDLRAAVWGGRRATEEAVGDIEVAGGEGGAPALHEL